MKRTTLRRLSDELMSLRHPGNDSPGVTLAYIHGIASGLWLECLITSDQYGMLLSLANNANNHRRNSPWPETKAWTPF